MIELGTDEAIVLFECLSRWTGRENEAVPPDVSYESPAEYAALLQVLGCLEKRLVAPFRADYADILAAARAAVTERFGNFLEDRPD